MILDLLSRYGYQTLNSPILIMNSKPIHRLIITITLFFGLLTALAQSKKQAVSFTSLTQNQKLEGFKVVAVYLNDVDKPMGARFVHQGTGFTLDLLQIESVPQAFVWVNSFPVSDKGEPHTQEHLLITKGNKGHELRTRENMSLAQSNAFTSQILTVYDFETGAGAETFYTLFNGYLDALLYPDYTNEEVKREVRNWGVSEAPDKTQRVEEKGSVYNEMSTSMNNPEDILYYNMGLLLYGPKHPMSFMAGGLPSGIRELTPKDIAKFHADIYHLDNMGAITSLPKSMALDTVLNRMNAILTKLNEGAQLTAKNNLQLPPPKPAEAGKIEVLDVPTDNASQPGSMMLAYPPLLNLSLTEYIELSNFMSVFAGDPTTNLYKLFIDSKTHIAGIDAQSVNGSVDNGEGNPVFIELDGIKAENLTAEKVTLVRQTIIDELKRVATFEDHSPELLEFNKRFGSMLESSIKSFNKFVNSPPGFGFRNTYDQWYDQLRLLKDEPAFKKSITYKSEIATVKKRLASGINIWRDDIQRYKLVATMPYVLVTKPNPALITQNEAEKKERAATEVNRLKKLYKLEDDQLTIARYRAEYDSNTTVLEKLEQAHNIKFIKTPPLTNDDELDFRQKTIDGKVPFAASVFNNMSSATTGLALNLKGVPTDKLLYLAMLPQLLTETGIIKNGKPIPYEEMIQMIQRQILSLESYYSTNSKTGRVELVVKGSGSNEAESLLSISWMADVLQHPYWTKANLPRFRDLVEQRLSQLRKTMQQPEEYWVNDPGNAYYNQANPLILSTRSYLTKTYNIFRLKWMLKDPGNTEDSAVISNYLLSLQNATGNRGDLKQLLSVLTADKPISADSAGSNKQIAVNFDRLPPAPKTLAKDAAADLTQILNDIPDISLSADWKSVCQTIMHDLAQTPAKTLADLNGLRESLLRLDNARIFMIGTDNTEQKLTASVQQLLAAFSKQPAVKQNYSSERLVDERVKARMHITDKPVFVGLINPDSPTGVFINTAPLITIKDTSKQKLLQYLASELYGGSGKQSVYTKTTGAGLSYSTGVGGSPEWGRFQYYAERTPELPQTLKFVIHEVKYAPVDSNVVDYVIAQTFFTNSAYPYEDRGEAMAFQIVDGETPAVVKTFRLGILKLRNDPQLLNEIYAHKDEMYEKILPGYGVASKDVKGGSYFVIGPEKQMVAYEAYLKSVEPAGTRLFRLYARDFWMVEVAK